MPFLVQTSCLSNSDQKEKRENKVNQQDILNIVLDIDEFELSLITFVLHLVHFDILGDTSTGRPR